MLFFLFLASIDSIFSFCNFNPLFFSHSNTYSVIVIYWLDYVLLDRVELRGWKSGGEIRG